jgi:ATP phosphoribosyltransferase
MASLTIALPKGRILAETLPLLARAGIEPAEDPETSRRLIIESTRDRVRFVIVRPTDVPTYVEYGAADLGVAGRDVLLEHGGEGLYQPIDLKIGRCKLVVAAKRGFDYAAAVKRGARLKVASKYVATAREHFAGKGMHVGLADAIVDLVSTGNTLKANDLVAVEEILPISARLIVNPASLKLKRDSIQPLLEAIAAVVEEKASA